MMETLLTGDELVSAVKGVQLGSAVCSFTDVQTDSRNVKPGCLFIPLVGEVQDGHKYISGAIEKGASVVFLDENEYENNRENWESNPSKYPEVFFVVVKNTLHALQDAAQAYVEKFPELIKISITGSCGKTTTKEMTVSVMKAKYGDKVVYTKGNFNSETGLPLSVFQIRKNHEIGIFEMGMNRENEIGEISKVLKSKYGIITNIGTAHIGILGSRENIAAEKRKSLIYIPENGAAFIPADDDYADYCAQVVKGKIVKFGKSVLENESGVRFISSNGLFGTTFSLDGVEINLPLSGDYNYQNALGVIACARELGLTDEEIKKGLEGVSAVSGRMEIKKITLNSGKEVVLIKDCYNANLDSMKSVIEFCRNLEGYGNKYFVLGDMKELGAESEKSHVAIGRLVFDVNPEKAVFIGPEMKAAYDVAESEATFAGKAVWYSEKSESNYRSIAEILNKVCDNNDVILLKGSHSMELEIIEPLLSSTFAKEVE